MAVNLQKGQKIDLTKGGTGLRQVLVGLGWDQADKAKNSGLFGLFSAQPKAIDCDSCVILCGSDGKIISRETVQCCIYFGNQRHSSGAIIHQGDNITGAGDGDDEQIMINLPTIPENIDKMVFAVNIYDADVRNQHFDMIKNAYIRLHDMENRSDICRFNLTEDYNGMTGLIVGEIYRKNGEWKFNAIGQPIKQASRLDDILKLYA